MISKSANKEIAQAANKALASRAAAGEGEVMTERANSKAKPMLTARPCMCCRKTFDSAGAHNRLCGPCKSSRSINPFEVITGTSRQISAR